MLAQNLQNSCFLRGGQVGEVDARKSIGGLPILRKQHADAEQTQSCQAQERRLHTVIVEETDKLAAF